MLNALSRIEKILSLIIATIIVFKFEILASDK